MKNIQQQFINFFHNDNLQNIFLTNLLLTILSVPCLEFDPDLVSENSIILEDGIDTKYSFLTIIRYLSKIKSKNIKQNPNFQIFLKRRILEFKEKEPIKILSKKIEHFDETLENKYQNEKEKYANFIIFFEFLKEFIYSMSHKHKFEGLVESIFNFYSDMLNDYIYANEDDSQEI